MPQQSPNHPAPHLQFNLALIFWSQFRFKFFGVSGFIALFFVVYLYVLKNPVYPVSVIPSLAFDDYVKFLPLAFPIYVSLWVYVSLPVMLMQSRVEIIRYGFWIGGMCALALGIFYFYPNSIAPPNIDWSYYPAIAFLKNIDASGNACPSLHVGTAVFTAIWLHYQLKKFQLSRLIRSANLLWCVAIAYSTLATKQHVTIDVIAGAVLGAAIALLSLHRYKQA
jgi:membrane-associated phospholipid phosphatase